MNERKPLDYAPRTGTRPPVGRVPGWAENAVGALLAFAFMAFAYGLVTWTDGHLAARSPSDCNQSTMKR